jgi:hypothetical protein
MVNYNFKWTEEEDAILLGNFCCVPDYKILAMLPGRTITAINARVVYLLKSGREFVYVC